MIKKVAFTTYPVKDMARARDFYENILSLKPNSPSPQESWVEYDLPGGGCFSITTMMTGVEPSSDAGGSIAFEVENLEGFVKDLKSKGVTFKMDIMETPVCHMAVALDSEGNGFVLHQVKLKN